MKAELFYLYLLAVWAILQPNKLRSVLFETVLFEALEYSIILFSITKALVINDLSIDLHDGIKLIALLEVLSGKKLPKHEENPTVK